MAAAYDGNSRLTQVTYPSGFVAHYGYNSLGYANQLWDGAAQTFWTASGMDAEQHITLQTSGNGIATTIYLVMRLYRPKTIPPSMWAQRAKRGA